MSAIDSPLSGPLPGPAMAAGMPAAGMPARVTPGVERLRLALIFMIAFTSGFVQREPAPYELIVSIAIVVFAATGLTLRATLLPLLGLLVIQNIGYLVSLMPVITLERTAMWTAVTSFLSITTLFFAMVLSQNTAQRLDMLIRGYIGAALVTAAIAILAFFRVLPGYDQFLLYDRAASTFKDPNVFGPFLVLPGLVLLQRMVSASDLRRLLADGLKLLVIAAGLLLTFSRGAWGHFTVSALVMLFLTYVTTRSASDRFRITFVSVIGVVVLAGLVLLLLSFDVVGDMFKVRANLVQDYDAGEQGRFGRHIAGALLVFELPWGVGPLQFSKEFSYEPHNSLISAFMNGGWIAGTTWLALTVLTLVIGLRHAFVRTPWQPIFIAAYATFVGEVGESWIIDVAHWRHYFLIMGIVWGLIAAGRVAPAPPDPVAYRRPQPGVRDAS
ncbi:O-antigen ligase family protein [Rhodoplanes sp. SY1]|uniref:O-antigen ligase family protein n=1 Tax=Rhodoplanes sp. SY1 TaxID=3166646 RepID=UPI0038B524A7